MLELRIRAKRFAADDGKPRIVLRDVTFTAVKGEILALLGRSGVGKSTVLRIALGLDRDLDGSASLQPGRVGVVFQEPRLLPWLTVMENLRLVLDGVAREPDLIGLLDDLGLAGSGGLRPDALSLGMARRVALARALAVNPDLLVLDEPFASLDRGLGAVLAGKVAARMRRRRTVVLLATHELEHALAIADRILVLSGSPATLAADIGVPDAANAHSIERLRRDLLARFPFLGTEDPVGRIARTS